MSKICIHTNKETTTKGVLHIVTFKFNIYLPPHTHTPIYSLKPTQKAFLPNFENLSAKIF